jgi:hypothetical protein
MEPIFNAILWQKGWAFFFAFYKKTLTLKPMATKQQLWAQKDSGKNEVLVLFIDEALPKSASKIMTRKIKEPYEGYGTFKKLIIKFAKKKNCNLAKIDEYHVPDKKKPEHQGTVSIYRINNIDSLQQKVKASRDSLDQIQLNEYKEPCLVYFFRPKTMIKTPFDLYIDNRFVKKMKADSTVIIIPENKTELAVSSGILSNVNSFIMRLTPGKIYYVECRTIGNSPFSMFPIFN